MTSTLSKFSYRFWSFQMKESLPGRYIPTMGPVAISINLVIQKSFLIKYKKEINAQYNSKITK